MSLNGWRIIKQGRLVFAIIGAFQICRRSSASCIESQAFALAAAYDTPTRQCAPRLGHDSPLHLAAMVEMGVDYHPIAHFAEIMGA